VGNPGEAGDLAQGDDCNPFFGHDFCGRIDQGAAQIAVVVGLLIARAF